MPCFCSRAVFFDVLMLGPILYFGSPFPSKWLVFVFFDKKFRHFADFASILCHFFFKKYLPLHAFFFGIALYFSKGDFLGFSFFALVFFQPLVQIGLTNKEWKIKITYVVVVLEHWTHCGAVLKKVSFSPSSWNFSAVLWAYF